MGLESGKYFPYQKLNDAPCYVHKLSNHPPSILRNIPEAISRRITNVSSDEHAFVQASPVYNASLKVSVTVKQSPSSAIVRTKRRTPRGKKRTRKVIWFNPPYSKNFKTPVGKLFLKLVEKHFPKQLSLHKIFNRHTVKVSYSCMENVSSVIKAHNNRLLNKSSAETHGEERLCNCCHKDQCLLNGACLTTSFVYKATVTTADSRKRVRRSHRRHLQAEILQPSNQLLAQTACKRH